MKLNVKKLHVDATLPTKAHSTDAGIDLYALEDVKICPGETVKVRTGISIQPVDENYCIPSDNIIVSLLWDRSSLGSRGIHRMAGVIDQAYTGEILVCLTNLNLYDLMELFVDGGSEVDRLKVYTESSFRIKKGDKIAQLLIQEVVPVTIEEVEELGGTERGSKGFGSSGK